MLWAAKTKIELMRISVDNFKHWISYAWLGLLDDDGRALNLLLAVATTIWYERNKLGFNGKKLECTQFLSKIYKLIPL